jgi:hypothetical protein
VPVSQDFGHAGPSQAQRFIRKQIPARQNRPRDILTAGRLIRRPSSCAATEDCGSGFNETLDVLMAICDFFPGEVAFPTWFRTQLRCGAARSWGRAVQSGRLWRRCSPSFARPGQLALQGRRPIVG